MPRSWTRTEKGDESMIPLHSILALKDVMIKLPMIAVIVSAVILVIAFIIGMVQGFRKVSWGGLAWAVVAVGFVFANKYLRDVNPLNKLFAGKFDAALVNFFSTLSIAVACVLVGLILYGILALILRPKKKWVAKDNVEYDDYGFEYEADEDVEGYEDKELVKIGYGTPCFFTRLMGGLTCVINTAMVLAVIFGFVTLIVSATRLYQTDIGAMYRVPAVQSLLSLAKTYLLDFVTVGIVFAVAFGGYEQGFLNSLRALIVYLGGTVCVVGCFILPFLKISETWPIGTFVIRCTEMFGGVENVVIRNILGRVLCGLLMAAVTLTVFIFLNIGLTKLCDLISTGEGSKAVDGCLSVLIYLVIGVAVVAALWSILYALEYCDLVHVSEIFGTDAPISNGFFAFGDRYIKPFAEKYLVKFK